MRRQNGFSLLELMVVAGIICALAAMAIPSYRAATRAAREAAAVSNMRVIAAAEALAASQHGGAYSPLSNLGPGGANLIDSELAAGQKQGYAFTLTDTDGNGGTGYMVRATPCVGGYREFTLDSAGVLLAQYASTLCQKPLADDKPGDLQKY